MVEAGIIAFVVVLVAIGSQVFYSHEQQKNREEAALRMQETATVIERGLKGMELGLKELEMAVRQDTRVTNEILKALAPLCESLAESLTARMSTIDSDMADLRTRVETGPGKRTIRL